MLIFGILWIIDLSKIVGVINIIRVRIFIITIITIIMAVSFGKKSVIFVAKKVIALIKIEI